MQSIKGQDYDGAANMSGRENGPQKLEVGATTGIIGVFPFKPQYTLRFHGDPDKRLQYKARNKSFRNHTPEHFGNFVDIFLLPNCSTFVRYN